VLFFFRLHTDALPEEGRKPISCAGAPILSTFQPPLAFGVFTVVLGFEISVNVSLSGFLSFLTFLFRFFFISFCRLMVQLTPHERSLPFAIPCVQRR